MKLIKKPSESDIEFFGLIPAYMMNNMSLVFFILLTIIIIVVSIVTRSISNEINTHGLKGIVEGIWYGNNTP